MAANFDAERKHVELDIFDEVNATLPFDFFRSSGRLKRFSLWRRDSVTSLVPVGYLVQFWIAHHCEDNSVISLTIVDGDFYVFCPCQAEKRATVFG